jgi:AraC-like DNA-binding protein
MRAHFEKLIPGRESFLTYERRDWEFPFYWHYHPEFELTLILDSAGQRLVGDSIADYGPGDLVLLGPNLPHSWRSGPVKPRARKIHRAVVTHFLGDFLGDRFFALEEIRPVARLLKRSASGLAFGHTRVGRNAARKLAELPSLPPSRRLLTLLTVLMDLAGDSQAKQLSIGKIRPMGRVEDQRRIDEICLYLNQHFDQEIDFTALANQVHMDQASVCRFFKRATGRTMTTYVNEIRVGAAAQLLMETDASILEIGFRVGFGNYSNFSRQFKRIKGYGPRNLRRHFLAKEGVPEISDRPDTKRRRSSAAG